MWPLFSGSHRHQLYGTQLDRCTAEMHQLCSPAVPLACISYSFSNPSDSSDALAAHSSLWLAMFYLQGDLIALISVYRKEPKTTLHLIPNYRR